MKNIASLALLAALSFATPALADPVVSGTGTLDSSDATQAGRVFRDGVASTWAAPKAFPSTFSGTYAYDLIDATFASNAVQDIYYEITYEGGIDQVFGVAYNGSFDPSNIATNYVGDSGLSSYLGAPQTFQVMIAAGGSLSLVLSNVTGTLPNNYNYSVTAYSDANRGENFLPVAGVPEPAAWGMMIGGFGLAGATLRRRSQKVVFAA